MISTELSYKIEKAIKFLILRMEESGHNPKPVVLHSILVGIMLAELQYPEEIVIAGILHDLIEDSHTSQNDIKKEFGENVARIVEVVSYNTATKDRTARYQDAIQRAISNGKGALIVMAADFTQNIPYYQQGAGLYDWLCSKVNYFIENTKEHIGNEPVFAELQKQHGKYLQ